MDKEQILAKLSEIIQPYVEEDHLKEIREDTNLLQDLNINSAHLVDIILDIEDAFDIEITDEEAEEMVTVNKTLAIIQSKEK